MGVDNEACADIQYYRKLDVLFNDIDHFCELPAWRKDFKKEWKKAMKKSITMLLNERYQPDVNQFVCTCSHFVVSQFLLCKHLICQEAALTRRASWRCSGGGVGLGPSGKQLHPATPELTAWREGPADSSQ